MVSIIQTVLKKVKKRYVNSKDWLLDTFKYVKCMHANQVLLVYLHVSQINSISSASFSSMPTHSA